MTENTAKKRWYVLQAFSGFEGRVAATLREYIKLHQMEEQFGEVLVPTEEVVENVGGKRRKSERKYFPGYVLVQMEMNDYTWQLVRSVPRVMGFIGGTPDKPHLFHKKKPSVFLIVYKKLQISLVTAKSFNLVKKFVLLKDRLPISMVRLKKWTTTKGVLKFLF